MSDFDPPNEPILYVIAVVLTMALLAVCLLSVALK